MKLWKGYLRDDQLADLEKLVKLKYPHEWKRKLAQEIRDAIDEHLQSSRKSKTKKGV